MKASQKQFLESEMQRDGEVFKQCHFYRRVGFDNEADFYDDEIKSDFDFMPSYRLCETS